MQYCSLQHWTLLLSPVPSTAGYCFCFGSIPSFFLELFLHWSPVAYWAPTDLESSSFSILSFCLFILFMGFTRQKHWIGLPFPSPVDHILSDLSTRTRPSWMAPWSWLSFMYFPYMYTQGSTQPDPRKRNAKKAKWLSEEALQIAVKRREAKSKKEKERYKHLNVEFKE